jgi:hypothetical protein
MQDAITQSERDDHDDRQSRDLLPAVLSLEHGWGTRESVRNMDNHRETSILPKPRKIGASWQTMLLHVPGKAAISRCGERAGLLPKIV